MFFKIFLTKQLQVSLYGCFNCFFQAIDDDANQTAQMTAAILDWPQVYRHLL